MSRIVLGLLHNYNTFVYSRFFNFNILHSFNNKPRVSLYATPLTAKQHAIDRNMAFLYTPALRRGVVGGILIESGILTQNSQNSYQQAFPEFLPAD